MSFRSEIQDLTTPIQHFYPLKSGCQILNFAEESLFYNFFRALAISIFDSYPPDCHIHSCGKKHPLKLQNPFLERLRCIIIRIHLY